MGYDPSVRRAFRIAINAATLVSAMLSVATVALWVRSYSHADFIYYTFPEQGRSFDTVTRESVSYGVIGRHGMLQVECLVNARVLGWWRESHGVWAEHQDGRWKWGTVRLDSMIADILLLYDDTPRGGIGWRDPVAQPLRIAYGLRKYGDRGVWAMKTPGVARFVTVPYWAVALTLIAGPAARLVSMRRRRARQHTRLCRTCGYDLRATPTRCPECGQSPA
jgi:hypothetical protein